MSKAINPAKLTPETLALLLSNAGQRLVTEQQVREIAEAGDLLAHDGTINLIHYTAYIAQAEGRNNNE